MRKLAIIHFNPIEYYPPVMNWLHYLAGRSKGEIEIRVVTMHAPPDHSRFDPPSAGIKIIRSGNSARQSAAGRYRNYLAFYTACIRQLIVWRPDTVLYYETLSAFPALLYKKLINRGSRILIHYHEYTSPKEYREGMILGKWGHTLEKSMYPSAAWISHTNEDRMGFFKEDNKGIRIANPRILPNYPPSSWRTGAAERSEAGGKRGEAEPVERRKTDDRAEEKTGGKKEGPGSPIKFVYVGALSLDTIYTKEFADWVLHQRGKVTWDIYSGNMSGEAGKLLSSLDSPWIRFHGRVDYFSLPGVLQDYDIGVILYKGHIPNYIYNSPNKLFEYWACGLDTWFPEGMKGSVPYITNNSRPKIIPVDFERLDDLDLAALTDHHGLTEKSSPYYCEEVFGPFFEEGIGAGPK